MNRKIIDKLCDWFHRSDRKPIVLRGARQVGKTWIVRYLTAKLDIDLLELNFERDPHLKTLFRNNDPQKTLTQLEAFFNKSIQPRKSLLFLDEIQAAPELLAKLRWFAEEQPELAVIATGSLLDFALDEHEFSMPVGRIGYMYLEPMSFEEFLLAQDQQKLCDFLSNYTLQDEIPEAIHNRLWEFLREYVFVGGMPAAVNAWKQNKSFSSINEIHQNILTTYRDDFAKYAKRISHERLEEVFRSIPHFIGQKFKYSSINKEIRSESLKKALNLLCKARICHKISACAADGIPIDAHVKDNVFKVILLDVGLVSAAMGLSITEIDKFDNVKLINEGGIAEQITGQLLRSIVPHYIDAKLHYWVREKTGAEAEIDYIVQHDMQIIPIEVKAGATGTLRSLHAFMKSKGLKTAVRLNSDYPSITDIKTKDHLGGAIEYQLISLPLYLTEQINRLLGSTPKF
ncbi:MAG: ATP-binding protein [Gammaproteobacteria bacterium]|nr:ATP-binding protein [Gammaproteobacteria bacterium]